MVARSALFQANKKAQKVTNIQNMLGVYQPDFGYLTDRMVYSDEMPISKLLIQPKAEGEIAFVLKRDLIGPGITNADVLAAPDLEQIMFSRPPCNDFHGKNQ